MFSSSTLHYIWNRQVFKFAFFTSGQLKSNRKETIFHKSLKGINSQTDLEVTSSKSYHGLRVGKTLSALLLIKGFKVKKYNFNITLIQNFFFKKSYKSAM